MILAGLFLFGEPMGKKQHYVPVFYLKGFVGDDAPFLWVYEKGKEPRKSRPDETGFENYFYSFTDKNGHRNNEYLENALNLKETAAAAVFEKIKSFQTIPDANKPDFAAFIALMIARVPSFRQYIDKLAAKTSKEAFKELASNPEAFSAFVAEMERDNRKDYGPVEDFRQYVLSDKYDVVQKNPDFALQFIAYAKGMETVLLKMSWQFMRATSRLKFLTSDNPVYKLGRRITDLKGELIFPVSSEICFRAHWNGQVRQVMYVQASDHDVKQANWMVTTVANRFVFGSEELDSTQEFVNSYAATVSLSQDGNVPNIPVPEFQ